MRICVVIDNWFPNIGGGPVHVYELASRLQRYHGVSIEIITSKLKIDHSSHQKQKQNWSNLKITRLGIEGNMDNIFDRVFFLFKLFFYLLTKDYDLLHVHPYSPLIIAKMIGILKAKPVVVTVHVVGVEPVGLTFHSILQKLDQFITYKIPYNAQIYVDENWLRRSHSVTEKKVFIANGVNIGIFDKVKGRKKNYFQFLFVGRFHPQKNLETLIRAFSIFIRKGRSRNKIMLLLVGDGPERKKIRELVENLQLKNNVEIPGIFRGKKLIRLYKESSAFILPSRYEGFPLTLLEAWAARLPVGVNPVGQMKKIVKHDVNGFISKDSSLSSLVKLLEIVYKSKRRRAIALDAYKTVKNFYSWELAASNTYKLYLDVIQNHKQSG